MESKREISGTYGTKLKVFLFCITLCMLVVCAELALPSRRAESQDPKSFGRRVFEIKVGKRSISEARVARRGLIGSSPPRCINKCATCVPCEAVLVHIGPGTPVVDEYYPQAWRCTCGGRLFIP